MAKKILIAIVIALVGILLWQIFVPVHFNSQEEIIFSIEKGEGSRDIALNLEKQGLISWSPIFRFYVLTIGVSVNLQAGEYSLSSAMNIPEMVEKFAKGEVITIKVTIPEGFTAEQIKEKLKQFSNIQDSELASLNGREGYLFPDTYHFSYNADLEEILNTIEQNFNRKITADLKEEIESQGKSLEQIIIMASLLEKELRNKEEKELASGILWKRLRVGMALQVDVTPWTYENPGLPEAPICNPGLESIVSAVYPEESQFWYYLSTPEGETIFSKTLEEHNIAKYQYLK